MVETTLKPYSCKKSSSERYDIRIPGKSDWAIVTISEAGGILSITSDYGDYSYNWPHRGGQPFKEFLLDIDTDYLLNKISSRSFLLVKETKEAWLKEIIQARKEDGISEYRYDNLDRRRRTKKLRDLAREAYNDIKGWHGTRMDEAIQFLHSSQAVAKIIEFPDFQTDWDPQARMFVERLWGLFIDVIRKEVKGEFSEQLLRQGVLGGS